jgi:hypothetical protein
MLLRRGVCVWRPLGCTGEKGDNTVRLWVLSSDSLLGLSRCGANRAKAWILCFQQKYHQRRDASNLLDFIQLIPETELIVDFLNCRRQNNLVKKGKKIYTHLRPNHRGPGQDRQTYLHPVSPLLAPAILLLPDLREVGHFLPRA